MLFLVFKENIMVPFTIIQSKLKMLSIIKLNTSNNGYLSIITFFVQCNEIIKYQYKLTKHRHTGGQFFQNAINKVLNFFSFNFSNISQNICAYTGINTVEKFLLKILFLFAISVWLLLFCCYVFGIAHLKTFTGRKSYKKLLYLFAIVGFMEAVRYCYSSLSATTFVMLKCQEIDKQNVWYYDATVTCNTWWQWSFTVFSIMYIIPFPLIFIVGPWALSHCKISAKEFIAGIFCPLPILLRWLVIFLMTNYSQHDFVRSLCDKYFCFVKKKNISKKGVAKNNENIGISKEIILNVTGPFSYQYWEGVIELRKLVLSLSVFISNVQIQLLFVSLFCSLMFIHQITAKPFKEKLSNHAESMSLYLLLIFSVINYCKALLSEYDFELKSHGAQAVELMEVVEEYSLVLLLLFIILDRSRCECLHFKKLWQERKRKKRNILTIH